MRIDQTGHDDGTAGVVERTTGGRGIPIGDGCDAASADVQGGAAHALRRYDALAANYEIQFHADIDFRNSTRRFCATRRR